MSQTEEAFSPSNHSLSCRPNSLTKVFSSTGRPNWWWYELVVVMLVDCDVMLERGGGTKNVSKPCWFDDQAKVGFKTTGTNSNYHQKLPKYNGSIALSNKSWAEQVIFYSRSSAQGWKDNCWVDSQISCLVWVLHSNRRILFCFVFSCYLTTNLNIRFSKHSCLKLIVKWLHDWESSTKIPWSFVEENSLKWEKLCLR